MAPLPPVANVLKYSQSWHLDLNQTAESILHFQYSGGAPSGADCAAIAAIIQAAAVTEFKPLMDNINQVGIGTILDLATNTGKEGVGGSATAGTRGTDPPPASTCVVVNHLIARRYRGGKPRTYCPFGLNPDTATTGTWQSSLLTATNTAWSNFVTTALTASSGSTTVTNFVSVSYFLNKALRVTPEVDTISQSIARTRIGTQRRRNKTA